MDTLIFRLTQLGISEYEAKAYRALLKESPSSAYEIAKNSGIPTSKIYEVIKRLELRQMAQTIHGEKTRMFIPQPLDEFIAGFKLSMEDNLDAVKRELQDLKGGIDTSYTWHMGDYEGLIVKAKRMISTAEKTIIISVWPAEFETLSASLIDAEARGLKVAVLHYGATHIKVGRIYRHPAEETIYSQRGGSRGFTLIADSKEAITAKISSGWTGGTEAIWSMNEAFVITAEGYVRHDIYQMKIMSRFAPALKEKFGEKYERLLDIYRDE
ncbi:MAG: TrmB family transcriptional regulator [Nitrospirae bacterium]|nr:TrmB family transcriptional regulator [Nitrospirota bacterium]